MERDCERGARWPRVILHADMDAFYAAVEQLDDPSLRGRPVLVGGTSPRSVVSTASYEARPFGVGSAMPMIEARRRCPEAVVVPPRFSRYEEASATVMEVFGHFSPLVEPLSLDEAFLDMTGAERLLGPPEEMGRGLKREVFEATGGLTVSVGLSTTKYVAKVASDHAKPDGLTLVPPGDVLEFLWPLPVSRLWGVGARTRQRLEELGLRTIGELARQPRARLEARLGALGGAVHRLAWGDDDRDVVSDREAKSVGAETTLEQDVVGREAVLPHLRRASERVGRRLRRAGLLAAGVRVKVKTSDFRLHTRQTLVRPPTDSTRTLLDAAAALLGELDLTAPMRLVGLAAFDLRARGEPVQGELFGAEDRERRERLDRVLDALKDRFGEETVHRGVEPDGPGASARGPSPRERRDARRKVRRGGV